MTVTTDQADSPVPASPPAMATPSTPTGRRRAPTRLVLALLCVFLLVVEGVVGGRLLQARSEQSDIERQAATEQVRLDGLLRDLDATRTRVAGLHVDAEQRQGEADSSGRIVAVRQVEIDELTGQLTRISSKARDLQTTIDSNQGIDKEQVRQLLLLTKCLDGIKLADVAAAQGRTADIVAALKGVSDVCQQTLEIISPGDTANFPFDFADPSVIYGDGRYYGYATNAAAGNVQVIASADLKHWEWVGGTLTSLPSWAVPGFTWAPSVLHRDKTYYMYYAARHAASKRQCISVARSAKPDGPFVDDSTGPLVCQLNLGGSIDASSFVAADGSAYLLWKSEGEVVGGSAQLWIRKLGDDYKSFDGDGVVLAGVDRGWEGRTVEGPSMAEANGVFYLFYSANRWDTADYAEGFAVCSKPTGPCTKPGNNVLLAKHDKIAGPGGGEVFMAPGGQLFISYHAWTSPNIGYPNKRQLHVDKLTFAGTTPQVASVS